MGIFSWLNPAQWSATFSGASLFLSVLAITLSAFALRRSRTAREGDIAQDYFSEYGSPQMLKDLKILGELKGKIDDDFLIKFKVERFSDLHMKEIDDARRRVKTHYLKAVWLHRRNLISEALFLTVIDSRGILLLPKVVGPLTRITDNLTNPELADFEYIQKCSRKLRWVSEYQEDNV
jgi:hypothetical protein